VRFSLRTAEMLMSKAVQQIQSSPTPINVTIVNGGIPDGFFNGVSWLIMSILLCHSHWHSTWTHDRRKGNGIVVFVLKMLVVTWFLPTTLLNQIDHSG